MDCLPEMAPLIMMKLLIAHNVFEQTFMVFNLNITFRFSIVGKFVKIAELKLFYSIE